MLSTLVDRWKIAISTQHEINVDFFRTTVIIRCYFMPKYVFYLQGSPTIKGMSRYSYISTSLAPT